MKFWKINFILVEKCHTKELVCPTLIEPHWEPIVTKTSQSAYKNDIVQNPMVTCVQECFFPKFGTCTWNGNFGVFLVKI